MTFIHSTNEIKSKVKVMLDKVELLQEAEVLKDTDSYKHLVDDIRALARDIANDNVSNFK
jgi:hypothetical protein